jgi:hypothetical protein
VGLRIAEVDQHTIAHVLRYEAAEAINSFGDTLLIGGNDLAQVLGVHTTRKCGRTNKVREHDRDLTTLCGFLRLRLRCSDWFRHCRWCASKVSDSRQHYPPMPEKDADVLKVLIGQVAERLGSNAVFGKTLDVLRHAELFEPVRNRLHRGPFLPHRFIEPSFWTGQRRV